MGKTYKHIPVEQETYNFVDGIRMNLSKSNAKPTFDNAIKVMGGEPIMTMDGNKKRFIYIKL